MLWIRMWTWLKRRKMQRQTWKLTSMGMLTISPVISAQTLRYHNCVDVLPVPGDGVRIHGTRCGCSTFWNWEDEQTAHDYLREHELHDVLQEVYVLSVFTFMTLQFIFTFSYYSLFMASDLRSMPRGAMFWRLSCGPVFFPVCCMTFPWGRREYPWDLCRWARWQLQVLIATSLVPREQKMGSRRILKALMVAGDEQQVETEKRSADWPQQWSWEHSLIIVVGDAGRHINIACNDDLAFFSYSWKGLLAQIILVQMKPLCWIASCRHTTWWIIQGFASRLNFSNLSLRQVSASKWFIAGFGTL